MIGVDGSYMGSLPEERVCPGIRLENVRGTMSLGCSDPFLTLPVATSSCYCWPINMEPARAPFIVLHLWENISGDLNGRPAFHSISAGLGPSSPFF